MENNSYQTYKLEELKNKIKQLQKHILRTSIDDVGTIINETQEPIFIKNKELQYIMTNRAIEKLFGLLAPQLLNKTDVEIFGKDVYNNTRISDTFVLDDNVIEVEQTYNLQNGFNKLRIFKAPLKDKTGKIIGICGIVHEIKDSKPKDEHKPKEYEEQLRSIINTSRDAIFIKDTNLKYTFVNPAMEQLLGLPSSELLGHGDDEIFGEDIGAYMKRVDYSVLGGRVIEEENDYEVRGTITTLHTVKTPLKDKYGKIVGIYGISRDITDHKLAERAAHKSEKQYQALLYAMPDLMFQVKDDGTIFDYKQAKNFKICPHEQLIGKNLKDILPPKAAKHALSLIKKAMESHTVQVYEFDQSVSDKTHYYETRVTHIDKDELLIIIRDITERKLAEEELKKRNEELDAFAHTVAHDLKNPLAGIITSADMLKMKEFTLDATNQEFFIETICASAHKMQNIIKELLLLAGVRKKEVEKSPLDMQRIVAEAMQRLSFMIKENNAEVIVPTYWPIAMGYAPWIEEVWANYISNAIKYGGKPPLIRLGTSVQDDGFIKFWVQDNGKGLTPKEQSKLFSEFTRLHQIRAEGQGLGLSIVRRILDKLGGKVGVESEIGKGSIFSFTLPEAYSNIQLK